MEVLEIIKNKEYKDDNKKVIIDMSMGCIWFMIPVIFILIKLFRLIF